VVSAADPDRPTGPALPAKVVDALARLARGQRAHRQAVATQHNLTPLQLELLVTLGQAPPPEPLVGALARELAVTQPTATDSLRSLEDKGLVTRGPDPTDRRRTTVALTPAGTAVLDQVATADRTMLDAVADLPADRQEAALGSLLDLIATMVDAGIVDVARTCTTCHHHRLDDNGSHRCTLLEVSLAPAELRVSCPDHRPLAAPA